MKRNFCLNLLLVGLLVSCGNLSSGKEIISLDTFDRFELHSEKQASYLNDTYDSIEKYATGTIDASNSNSVTLSFKTKLKDKSFMVHLSENEFFVNEYVVETTSNQVKIPNLKTKTKYYWKVSCDEYESKVSYFETCHHDLRNLYIDRVGNCRDLGGYSIENNSLVKVGMIFRGSKIAYNTEEEDVSALISKNGIKEFLRLGIKTQIDLRSLDSNGIIDDSKAHSVIDGVGYVQAPMDYENPQDPSNYPSVIKVFDALKDESNYPIFFHCSQGTDRTGYIAFLINGLLGVSKEDLYRDYLFSNFYKVGDFRTLQAVKDKYLNQIEEFEGTSFKEKMFNYIVSIGVKEETLNKIINIMKVDQFIAK